MPKKIKPEDEFYEEDNPEDDPDYVEEEQRPVARPVKRGKPPVVRKTRPQVQQPPVEPQRRFEAFHQPEVIGVRDSETGEILAQGFSDLGNAMIGAEQLERLERIENAIGVIEG